MKALIKLGLAFAALSISSRTEGIVIIRVFEAGNDVVAQFEGDAAVQTLGNYRLTAGHILPELDGISGEVILGHQDRFLYVYDLNHHTLSSPLPSFGLLEGIRADESIGDFFGFTSYALFLSDYSGPSPVSIFGTSIWHNKSLEDLKLVEGEYTGSWGYQTIEDQVHLIIGAQIPEPSSHFIIIFTTLFALARRKIR